MQQNLALNIWEITASLVSQEQSSASPSKLGKPWKAEWLVLTTHSLWVEKLHLGWLHHVSSASSWTASGKLTVCYWKWPFRVDLPIKNDDFFHSYVSLPEGISDVQIPSSRTLQPHHGCAATCSAGKSVNFLGLGSTVPKREVPRNQYLYGGFHKWGYPKMVGL